MRNGPLDRRALFASGAAAALLAATGLSGGPLPRRGGTLRLAVSGASRQDDWLHGDGTFMRLARAGLVFETLAEVAGDGTLRGELATGWDSTADAGVWRFTLREGVAFHDGVPFTAADAVASLSALGAVRAVGRHAIDITLATPDPALPFALARDRFVMRPAHARDAGIGTGLYRVARFAPGRQLSAQRVAQHWKDGTAGWFDQVELVAISAEAVRAQAVAEYVVEGADIADASALAGLSDIAVFDGHAVARSVAVPRDIGLDAPFDGLRAPQRWWMA